MKKEVLGLASGAMALKLMSTAGLVAMSTGPVMAETSAWCDEIAGGVFCAEHEETPPAFCGTEEVTVALADGFAQNPWRQQTAASALNEASRCPNVTGWIHTDGQGNTQKSISDLNGLAATGVEAIVVFPDAGPAMLPAIRDAYNQGSAVVPYSATVGGTAGQDYTVFVGADQYQVGLAWGNWMVEALGGEGQVAYLGGPAGNSKSRERGRGIAAAFADHPGMELVGESPFEVTNWDPSVMATSLTALLAQYPEIDGVVADLSIGIVSSGVFERAGRDLPLIAGEDANIFGCTWREMHAADADAAFQYMTVSGEQWHARLAIRHAIAAAAGGTLVEPLAISTPTGDHVVAQGGDSDAVNFVLEDSLQGITICNANLPDSASNGTGLSEAMVLQSLRGGL